MDNRIIKFYRVENEFGIFSNFSMHPIGLDGTMWPTVEHYFQAQKFTTGELKRKVQLAKTPGEAAKIGRSKSNPLRPDWEDVKDGIMKKAVYAKVMQHYEVRKALLETGDAVLIEHTKNDNYWGDGGNGQGKNMLGKILMEIRNDLNKDAPFDEFKDPMLPVWLRYPEIKRRSVGWRMGAGEEYAWNFSLWWGGLSEESKNKYKTIYPEPEEWKGWYSPE